MKATAVSFLLGLALAQLGPPRPDDVEWIVSNPATMARPEFELAPFSGAGMTAACACDPIYSAQGHAVTWARDSGSACLTGPKDAGIATGSMVLCGVNEPIVSGDWSGSSVMGLWVWTGSSNNVLRTHPPNWGAADWVADDNSGDFGIWANDAGDLEGNATADAIRFGATTGTQYSTYYQQITPTLTPTMLSVALKAAKQPDGGAPLGGTTDLCAYENTVTSAWTCQSCDVPSDGGWSFCEHLIGIDGGAVIYVKIGNNSNQNGGVARTAVDVLADCFQAEPNRRHRGPCIPTTSAVATRDADEPTLTGTFPLYPVSMSATVESLPDGVDYGFDKMLVYVSDITTPDAWYAWIGWLFNGVLTPPEEDGTLSMRFLSDGHRWQADAGILHPNRKFKLAGYVHDQVAASCVDGTCYDEITFTSQPGVSHGSYMGIGHWLSGHMDHVDGYIANVCVDSSPTRCR